MDEISLHWLVVGKMSEIFFFGYMVDCKMCYSVFGLVKCLVRRGKRSCVVKWLLRCVRCISLLV